MERLRQHSSEHGGTGCRSDEENGRANHAPIIDLLNATAILRYVGRWILHLPSFLRRKLHRPKSDCCSWVTWWASPDAHLCTIRDFVDMAELIDAEVVEAVAFNTSGKRLPIKHSIALQNLLGEKAVFLLRRR
mgnify:CR=1 FL=1